MGVCELFLTNDERERYFCTLVSPVIEKKKILFLKNNLSNYTVRMTYLHAVCLLLRYPKLQLAVVKLEVEHKVFIEADVKTCADVAHIWTH